MPHDLTTSVLRNIDLGRGHHLIELAAPPELASTGPAQFFMVGVPGTDTLLRRPYSVCGLPGTFADGAAGAVQILLRVVGRGTRLLASLAAGAPLHVLGPLGRGFEPPAPGVRPVLVAGGIGAAPFPAFVASLAGRDVRPVMFYGARTDGDLPLADWFRERVDRFEVTTEDGSAGRAGLVTEPLAEALDGIDPASVRLYACGPDAMLRAVARLAVRAGVACDLSLEAHMACGFGVCLGCVVPVRDAAGGIDYARVCVEGPVMPADRMGW